MTTAMRIQPLTEIHWPAVWAIYEQGIATGNATFQTSAPEWSEWTASHLPHSRLVFLDEQDCVLGWAALTPVSGRCVYAGVAEVSVYVAGPARGQGIGRQLLAELVRESEQQGIWTLQAGIFPENAASIRLHEAYGFRLVGRRERIGQLKGVWRDTVLLERRSPTVGAELTPTSVHEQA
ncbi:N-acetyltransferase family protein [Hymenobacter sp. BT175]|uniref:GNAT family N-acetyltransferase n=1 Tax=Hymenobacter translucens TaxID=2886507 RepID=UPI001D0F06A4|nr:GNAT family N-acetyltransferase [Hymenobacter translucens]MCC2545214.1 N-acetyltransferase family protein [Hymenobacter translucens]